MRMMEPGTITSARAEVARTATVAVGFPITAENNCGMDSEIVTLTQNIACAPGALGTMSSGGAGVISDAICTDWRLSLPPCVKPLREAYWQPTSRYAFPVMQGIGVALLVRRQVLFRPVQLEAGSSSAARATANAAVSAAVCSARRSK